VRLRRGLQTALAGFRGGPLVSLRLDVTGDTAPARTEASAASSTSQTGDLPSSSSGGQGGGHPGSNPADSSCQQPPDPGLPPRPPSGETPTKFKAPTPLCGPSCYSIT
jgi:hypothetical protein